MSKQTIQQAEAIAVNCARCFRIAGHLADVPYSQAQLCEVIATLLAELTIRKDAESVANRRYAASNARYQKLAKKTGQNVAEENEAI
jgi:hypothetical protein